MNLSKYQNLLLSPAQLSKYVRGDLGHNNVAFSWSGIELNVELDTTVDTLNTFEQYELRNQRIPRQSDNEGCHNETFTGNILCQSEHEGICNVRQTLDQYCSDGDIQGMHNSIDNPTTEPPGPCSLEFECPSTETQKFETSPHRTTISDCHEPLNDFNVNSPCSLTEKLNLCPPDEISRAPQEDCNHSISDKGELEVSKTQDLVEKLLPTGKCSGQGSDGELNVIDDNCCETEDFENLNKCSRLEQDLAKKLPPQEKCSSRDSDSKLGIIIDDCCEAGNLQDLNKCSWLDWGEPLPPEDIDLGSCLCPEKQMLQKDNSPDLVALLEDTGVQEEREILSFSYPGSSDDDFENCTSQMTSNSDFGLWDIPKSSLQLLGVSSSTISGLPCSATGKESSDSAGDSTDGFQSRKTENPANCGDFETRDQAGGSGRGLPDSFDASLALEELSMLVDKVYMRFPESDVSVSMGGREVTGSWTIDLSKDYSKFRMKRIKHDHTWDLDCSPEGLYRPPWMRKYKSLRTVLL